MQRKQEKHHAEDDEITLEYVSDDESNNTEKDQQQLLLMEPIENESYKKIFSLQPLTTKTIFKKKFNKINNFIEKQNDEIQNNEIIMNNELQNNIEINTLQNTKPFIPSDIFFTIFLFLENVIDWINLSMICKSSYFVFNNNSFLWRVEMRNRIDFKDQLSLQNNLNKYILKNKMTKNSNLNNINNNFVNNFVNNNFVILQNEEQLDKCYRYNYFINYFEQKYYKILNFITNENSRYHKEITMERKKTNQRKSNIKYLLGVLFFLLQILSFTIPLFYYLFYYFTFIVMYIILPFGLCTLIYFFMVPPFNYILMFIIYVFINFLNQFYFMQIIYLLFTIFTTNVLLCIWMYFITTKNLEDSFKKKQDSLMMKSKLIVNERIKEQRLVERKRDLLREKLKMVETIKERSNDRSNEGITVMKSEKNNGCVIL